MNHQLYEDWLFAFLDLSDQDLSESQVATLKEHLSSCESCRSLVESWQQVETQLNQATLLEATPDFTNRWQARLVADRQRTHRKQIASALVFSLGGAILVSGLLLFFIWPYLQSPGVILWVGLYRLFAFFSFAQLAGDFLASLFLAKAGTLSTIWWMLFVGLLCELGVLWVVSLRLLTDPRRILR